MISRYFRKGAHVLTAKTEDPFLRTCVLENRDGTKTLALVNLGPKRTVSVAGWGTYPRDARFYLYDSARPRLNAFGDLPAPDGTLMPVAGTFALEIPEKGMAFVTTDYQSRTPAAVKDVKVENGRLTWTATDDPNHCYYRVYANGRQIASTVATSYEPQNASSTFTVRSVDRWGNVGSADSGRTRIGLRN